MTAATIALAVSTEVENIISEIMLEVLGDSELLEDLLPFASFGEMRHDDVLDALRGAILADSFILRYLLAATE